MSSNLDSSYPHLTRHAPKSLGRVSENGREWWLKRRKIGGSDAPVILGISSYKTPERLRLEKLGRIQGSPVTEGMEIGSLIEPMIGTLFGVRTGLKVIACDHIYVHPDFDHMTATPDCMVVDPSREDNIGLVQIKNVGEYHASAWADGAPDAVHAQIQHELAVTGYSYAYAVALIGGNKLVHYRIERDDDYIAELIEHERVFWEHVTNDIPFPLTANDTETVELLYPASTQETRELSSEAMIFIDQYEQAKRDADDANDRKQVAANCLRAMLGEAKEGRIGAYRVRWVTQERKGYVVEPTSFRKFEVRTVKS